MAMCVLILTDLMNDIFTSSQFIKDKKQIRLTKTICDKTIPRMNLNQCLMYIFVNETSANWTISIVGVSRTKPAIILEPAKKPLYLRLTQIIQP